MMLPVFTLYVYSIYFTEFTVKLEVGGSIRRRGKLSSGLYKDIISDMGSHVREDVENFMAEKYKWRAEGSKIGVVQEMSWKMESNKRQ